MSHASAGRAGSLEIIVGNMFAGKTTELFARLRRQRHSGRRVVLIKPKRDTRYDGESAAVTHDDVRMRAVPFEYLRDAQSLVDAHDVVGVEEGQFFPDLDLADRWADQGKIVVVAALSGTYRREPWPNVADLVPRADSICHLRAVCADCKSDLGGFTARKVRSSAVEDVGGADKYAPTCRRCHRANYACSTEPEDGESLESVLRRVADLRAKLRRAEDSLAYLLSAEPAAHPAPAAPVPPASSRSAHRHK